MLAPAGAKARAAANLAAIDIMDRLAAEARPATLAEQQVLATWSGWGAVPAIFDERDDSFADERDCLREKLDDRQWERARASVLNAHYTDPALAAVIWECLQRAGFEGGRTLEPGCGAGVFFNHAPPTAQMVGVETDPVSAALTSRLYPSAQVRNEGFEQTLLPEGSFVATVGNVPFGRYALHDPVYNGRVRMNIHNHFIHKSLALTAPGGYVAVLTSRYTLDSASTTAREVLAERADLVTAIRLPGQAFSRVAGTQVVTDLLVLRVREEPRPADERPIWLDTVEADLGGVDDEGRPLRINAYFRDNPHQVLGTLAAGHGLYGPDVLVNGASGPQLAGQLRTRLSAEVDRARDRGLALTATADSLAGAAEQTFAPGLRTPDELCVDVPRYTLRFSNAHRRIEYWTGHLWEPQKIASTQVDETRRLIELRDLARDLIAAQQDGRPGEERDQLRARLNRSYDTYARKYGPINRFSTVQRKEPTEAQQRRKVQQLEAKWRKDEGTAGQPYTGLVPEELRDQWDLDAAKVPAPYKIRPHLDGGMRHDPGWGLVSALEDFNEDTGVAVFSSRLSAVRHVRRHGEMRLCHTPRRYCSRHPMRVAEHQSVEGGGCTRERWSTSSRLLTTRTMCRASRYSTPTPPRSMSAAIAG